MASTRLIEYGIEEWPGNPLTTLKRVRNVKVNLDEGIPDEDNEWQFSLDVDGQGTAGIMHQSPNDEIYYYAYDSLNFTLSEDPILYIAQ